MTDLRARRFAMHEEALQDLRSGAFTDAARGIRRLLMMLPVEHPSRCDVLYVLSWVEHRAAEHAPSRVQARD